MLGRVGLGVRFAGLTLVKEPGTNLGSMKPLPAAKLLAGYPNNSLLAGTWMQG